MKKIFTLSVISTAVLLTGCASTIQAEKNIKENLAGTEQTYQGAKMKTTPAAQDESRDKKSNFAKVKKNWVNPNPLPRYDVESAKANIPKFFQDKISLTMPGKVSLVEVVSELQRAKKIKFIINQDVYNSSVGTGSIISGGSAAGAASATTGTAPVGAAANSIGTNGAIPIYVNDFVFRGTLEESLDLMSAKANISWKWNGTSIEIYRFETRNYSLSALAGKTTTSSNVSMAGSSTGATGAAGSAVATNSNGVVRTSDITTWDDVKAYLMTLTSKDGKIAVMESSGIITIKDTPMVQDTIEKAMKELNDNLGKQIYMDVKIYSVSLTDADNYGLNWNLAWAQAAGRYGINLAGAGAGLNASSPISIGTSVRSGPFAGTNATLQALSTIGKTNIVNEFTVSTLNGQTTPIGNSTKQDYVKQVKVTVTGSGANPTTSVEVTPDAVYDGINMSVTPKLQKDMDKILLEYSLTLNTIDDMSQTYTDSTGNKVTLPRTSIKNILQRSALRSGQTLVLSGFKQNTTKIQNDGVGSANFQLLGGGRNSNNTSQYLVITVTPYVAQE